MRNKLTYKRIYTVIIVTIILIIAGGVFGSYMAVHNVNAAESSGSVGDENADLTVIGFSQPAAESTWRVALTESVKDVFTEERGYKLIYKDGQSKQDNQIKDIRTFIQQGVDYIVLSPIVQTGWDQVLEEAKAAGIPVIICDRAVTVSNESLYTAFVGSNFREEGMAAIECVEKINREREAREAESKEAIITVGLTDEAIPEDDTESGTEALDQDKGADDTGEKEENPDSDEAAENGTEITEDQNTDEADEGTDYFNIVHIQGTIGSSAQIGRSRALEEAVAEHSDWRIVAQECGDFTKAKAREEMTNILKEIDGSEIDMIYCENDDEAFGVMAALNEAGLSYGVGGKIMIVSFDGTKDALSMCMSGLINVEVECNPLQGTDVYNIVRHLQAGEKVPKIAYVGESYYTSDMLTPEIINSRVY